VYEYVLPYLSLSDTYALPNLRLSVFHQASSAPDECLIAQISRLGGQALCEVVGYQPRASRSRKNASKAMMARPTRKDGSERSFAGSMSVRFAHIRKRTPFPSSGRARVSSDRYGNVLLRIRSQDETASTRTMPWYTPKIE
jgi:hypothetical protein